MPQLARSASKSKKQARVHEEMGKFKRGTLHSSNGKKVTGRKQAIAIALNEAGKSKRNKRKVHKR